MPSEPFMGEIMYLPVNFAPKGWALCNGQSIPIAQNQALFALLGVTFGGNGTTSFNLPDLRGRAIMGGGISVSGPGTTTTIGSVQGTEQVQLTIAQMPAHSHSVSISNAAGTSPAPATGTLGATSGAGPSGNFNVSLYAAGLTSPAPVASAMVGNNGGGGGHENRQPYATLSACIALVGIFPNRQ